jgi:hypothetical protein
MRFGCNDFTAASNPSGSESTQVNQTILISDVILVECDALTKWSCTLRKQKIARTLG